VSRSTDIAPARLAEAAALWPDADREELIDYLEADQLVQERSRPLGRRRLSQRAIVLLWALRVFVVVIGLMVIYTFLANLSS
jgi:hypothetical protein